MKEKISFLDYLVKVINALVVTAPPTQNFQLDETVSRLQGRHFGSYKEATPGAKCERPSKKCSVCTAKGKRTEKGHLPKTTYICPDCPTEPGIHPGDCFREYHTKVDYSV